MLTADTEKYSLVSAPHLPDAQWQLVEVLITVMSIKVSTRWDVIQIVGSQRPRP